MPVPLNVYRLGLSATNEKGNLCSARKYKVAHPLLGQVEEDFFQTEDCIYQQALQQQEPLLVEDLTQLEEATEVEAELLNSGIRSIIIFPLRNKKGKLAGFLELGAAEAFVLPFASRDDCRRADWLARLAEASGVFLTGGNQLKLSTTLGGTPVADALQWLNELNLVTVSGGLHDRRYGIHSLTRSFLQEQVARWM